MEEERRKRKAFADIKRSGHSKQIQHAVSVQSTVVRQAQFVLRRRFTVANKFARFAITFALLTTSPVIRTNGAMQIVASHYFSFHKIATMLRRWWARPLRSVFSNATRLILPLLAVIRTKSDGL